MPVSQFEKTPDPYDAVKIFRSALRSVAGDVLVKNHIALTSSTLTIGESKFNLESIGRIIVLGAGKAGASMAYGLEQKLLPEIGIEHESNNVSRLINDPYKPIPRIMGQVNVSDDVVYSPMAEKVRRIKLNAVRPAALNMPTERSVKSTDSIIQILKQTNHDDVCIFLWSGGASAMLAAPVENVSVDDKVKMAQLLSARGANIEEINSVRQRISRVKGGKLLGLGRPRRQVALIISDIVGNPIDLIGSGPTALPNNHLLATDVLKKYDANRELPEHLYQAIFESEQQKDGLRDDLPFRPVSQCANHIIGDITTAVASARESAESLGYQTTTHWATSPEGDANRLGIQLADKLFEMLCQRHKSCHISGGEPTVQLAEKPGVGGRNQQLVLAALGQFLSRCHQSQTNFLNETQPAKFCFLSAGTDGEDGPTSLAGGWFDAKVARAAAKRNDLQTCLESNNTTPFLESIGGTLKTGPTQTNVGDLRILLAN